MLDAAKAMKLSAKDLLELEVIDEIIKEPIGGAHRDKSLILENIRSSISFNLNSFKEMSAEEIIVQRKNKFLKIGRTKGFIENLEELSDLKSRKDNFLITYNFKKINYIIFGVALVASIIAYFFL